MTTDVESLGGAGVRRKLRKASWEKVAEDLAEAVDQIERIVLKGRRAVMVASAEGTTRVTAFGQWTTEGYGNPPEGQHGIFGSAAALEVLASARRYRDLATEREEHIAGCWWYLKSRLDPPESAPAPQLFLVLRQALILRALSATERHFNVLAGQAGERLGFAADSNSSLARKVVEAMESCRESKLDVALNESITDGHGVAGYRFASTSSDTPKLDTDWAFHLAVVLIAVVRCSNTGLLADPSRLFSTEECHMLTRWTIDALADDRGEQLRVGLFTGAALLQLFAEAQKTEIAGLGSLHNPAPATAVASLAPAKELRDRLATAMRRAVQRTLADPVLRGDLHLPYFFRFEPAGSEDEGRPDAEPYRQEHFVVPTVPILISAVARLGGDMLGDRRFGMVLREVLSSIKAVPPRVVPAQPSGANGTVNMMYLHEALAELHEAAVAWTQLGAVQRGRAVIARYRPSAALLSNPYVAGTVTTLLGVVLGLLLGST